MTTVSLPAAGSRQTFDPYITLPPNDPSSSRPALPSRIEGLRELAGNLAWSWNREARHLFRLVDASLWHATRHSPLAFLEQVDPARLAERAADPVFVAAYDHVMRWFRAERSSAASWFSQEYPDLKGQSIAYFCAEFGLHNSLPIYSGGLGVLAGDHCKTASDLGVPLVAVGILYRAGYFDQRVNLEGWQGDAADPLDLRLCPLTPIPGVDGADHLVEVQMEGRTVYIRAWSLAVGRVPVILLDSDLPSNDPQDRPLLSKLYAGGPPMRLKQEWLLGVGGVRVLRALGISPGMWHANEGHAAFMHVERLRECTARGMSLADAMTEVRMTSLFTTHTPVPAGHDTFGTDAVVHCTGPVWQEIGMTQEEFLSLARTPHTAPNVYHMTALAIRLSHAVNGVAMRHGIVTRELWHELWPHRETTAVPVGHITNGVHLATWMANPMMALLDRHLGRDWGAYVDEPAFWQRVMEVPDAELWEVHQALKRTLFAAMRDRARASFTERSLEAAQIVGAGTLMDPAAFTIGFARRFATYKRADLIFRDPERLRRLVTNRDRPVQIIFSGKAHPADTPGKQVLQRVYEFTRDPRFEGRIAFLDDYQMHLAHLLVQGVDMWMNVPRVPMEASGTSGMKAALNGVPQLSTVDGWWEEGYDGTNGWAIATHLADDADEMDAERLYQLLEQEVVPRFYDRKDLHQAPARWAATMKHSMRQAGAKFTASRMVRDYVQQYYAPGLRRVAREDVPPIR